MPRLLEISIVLFAQCIAVIAILMGLGSVATLWEYASAASRGQPWQMGELARRIALVCGPVLVGTLTVIGLTWHLWSTQVLRGRMRQYPDTPWMWRRDWAAKMIHLSNRVACWITLVSTALYLFVVVPMGIYLASLKNATMVYAFVGAIGCFLLLFFRLLWVNFRWNRSCIQLETLPGEVGGRFSGVVTIPDAIPVGTTLRIALRCDMTRSTSRPATTQPELGEVALGIPTSRDGHSTLQTQTVHEDHFVFTVPPATAASHDVVIPVSFEIPVDLPSSGKQPTFAGDGRFRRTRITDYCHWFVQVKPAQPSDLREIHFEIPVFDIGK